MITLNLKANTPELTVLKEYLEENASATLAEKINNGVFVEKDGKRLLNKKDLVGFMKYACNEAKKLADKNATSACVKSDIVFGWAIHYFEEDEIIGTLYNEDGSEYKPAPKPTPKPVKTATAPTIPIKQPTPPKSQQFNLFDMLAQIEESTPAEPMEEETVTPLEESEDIDNDIDEPSKLDVDIETGEILSSKNDFQGSPLYQKYMYFQNQNPQAVIAYRVGDFFEIFGENAIKIANHLDLTLTSRDCGLNERIAMVGFPYHASDTYFRKIAQISQLIIVVDNIATPYVLEEITTLKTPKTEENESDFNDDFEEERALQQFFDKDALCLLYELFDYNLDMQ